MIVGVALFPLLAFAFVFADALITAVYTAAYVNAVPVMRVYSISSVAYVVELNSIMMLLRQGPFAMRVNFVVLLIGIPSSLAGALIAGLPGAAAGSVAAIFAERAMTLYRVSSLTGVPIRRLQEWAGLARVLVPAACSAALAGWLVEQTAALAPLAPLVRVAEGAAIMALVYPVALLLAGQRRLLFDLIGLLLREKRPAPDPQPERT
jgi:O-antigen/teichoic acid export membrane protein